MIHCVLLPESGCGVKDGWCDRGVSVVAHGASPPSLDRCFFFFEATVLLTWEQRGACQEVQSWRVHVTSFDRWRDAGSRVTERAAEQERRKVSIISDDSSFCARRMTARQAFVPAFRTHCACVQISVFELQHFGCGCGCF